MTFHGMYNHFNRENLSDSLSIQIKQICNEIGFNIMGSNVNPDKKRFRYSDVNTAIWTPVLDRLV